jgi:twitching motility protein PilT
MDFPALFKKAVDSGASDIHLRAGRSAALRIHGSLVAQDGAAVTSEDLLSQLPRMLPEHLRGEVNGNLTGGLDFSYTDPAAGRFRCSAFKTLGRIGMTMRTIRSIIPSLDALHLPSSVMDIALSQRGLTLVTGTTGSGKSTTLAAMIDLINSNYDVKVITVEDPIEFVHQDKRALINQIEIGSDCLSFDQALRQAASAGPGCDPDRRAAATWRRCAWRCARPTPGTRSLRPSRLAGGADDRAHHRDVPAGRAQGAAVAVGALAGGDHLTSGWSSPVKARAAPAVEILRGGPVTEKYILEGKLNELTEYLQSGQSGMQSFDQHLLEMYSQRLIAGTEALKHANRPEALATAMRGIKYTGQGKI